MKQLLLSFLLLPTLLMTTASAQTGSDCSVPAVLRTNYAADVSALAVEAMYDSQSADTELVDIGASWTTPIWEGLAAIYNVQGMPVRDTVLDIYCIHHLSGHPNYYMSYMVEVDTTYGWTAAWKNLTALTGNPQVDSLVTRYSLRVAAFHQWVYGSYAELVTDSSWNEMALMDSLGMLTGVLDTEPSRSIGLAGRMTYAMTPNGRQYDFYVEWGDCPSGCQNYRKWKFLVDGNCTVSYLGMEEEIYSPEPMPAPTNCNLSNGLRAPVTEEFEVFPNPSRGEVWLDYSDGAEVHEVWIRDMMGRTVREKASVRNGERISLDGLTPGAYIVSVQGYGGRLWSRRLLME